MHDIKLRHTPEYERLYDEYYRTFMPEAVTAIDREADSEAAADIAVRAGEAGEPELKAAR